MLRLIPWRAWVIVLSHWHTVQTTCLVCETDSLTIYLGALYGKKVAWPCKPRPLKDPAVQFSLAGDEEGPPSVDLRRTAIHRVMKSFVGSLLGCLHWQCPFVSSLITSKIGSQKWIWKDTRWDCLATRIISSCHWQKLFKRLWKWPEKSLSLLKDCLGLSLSMKYVLDSVSCRWLKATMQIILVHRHANEFHPVEYNSSSQPPWWNKPVLHLLSKLILVFSVVCIYVCDLNCSLNWLEFLLFPFN